MGQGPHEDCVVTVHAGVGHGGGDAGRHPFLSGQHQGVDVGAPVPGPGAECVGEEGTHALGVLGDPSAVVSASTARSARDEPILRCCHVSAPLSQGKAR